MSRERVIGVLLLVLLTISPIAYTNILNGHRVYAAETSDPATIVESTKPAVVEVVQSNNVTISAPMVLINTEALKNKVADFVNQGRLDQSDMHAVLAVLNNLILTDPAAYVAPSKTKTVNFKIPLVFTGSGFISTPDGHIVTNAHVVKSPSVEDALQILGGGQGENYEPHSIDTSIEIIRQLFAQDFPQMASIDLTTKDILPLVLVLDKYYQLYSHVDDVPDTSILVLSKSRFGNDQNPQQVSAQVIPDATGEVGGKDVAIIKIEGNNLPTLKLGDEKSLRSLDDLITIGYPGSVSNTLTSISKQPLTLLDIEPSASKGQFSGFQPSGAGFNYVEVEIPQAHGSSGSPVVDLSGKVIGIITLGTPDQEGASSPFGLLIPVSVVKEYLQRAGVNLPQGDSSGVPNNLNDNLNKGDNNSNANDGGNGDTITAPPSQQQQTPSSGSNQQDGSALTTTNYRNNKLGISLAYPSNWKIEEEFEGGNSVRFLDDNEPGTNFAQVLDIWVETPGSVSYYPSTETSLSEAAQGMIESLKANFKDFKLVGERSGPTIDGNPSVLILYTYTDAKIGSVVGMRVITIDGANAYELVYVVKAEEVNKEHFPIILGVMSTFKAFSPDGGQSLSDTTG